MLTREEYKKIKKEIKALTKECKEKTYPPYMDFYDLTFLDGVSTVLEYISENYTEEPKE